MCKFARRGYPQCRHCGANTLHTFLGARGGRYCSAFCRRRHFVIIRDEALRWGALLAAVALLYIAF